MISELRLNVVFNAVIPLLLMSIVFCPPIGIAVAVGLLGWGAVYFVKCWLAAPSAPTADEPAPQNPLSLFDPHEGLRELATATRGNPLVWAIVVPAWFACLAVVVQDVVIAMTFSLIAPIMWLGANFNTIFVEAPRTQALRAVAKQLGLRFQECPSFAALQLEEWAAGFEMLPDGQSTHSLNWIQGEWRGLHVDIFDFHSNIFPIDGCEQDAPLTTVCFRNDAIELPSFTLRARRLMHQAADRSDEACGDVPPEVNRQFLVQGEDPQVGDLFSADVVGFVRSRPELIVEGGAGRFARYRDRKYLTPEEIPQFLEETLALVAKLCSVCGPDRDSPLAAGLQEAFIEGEALAGA